MNPNVADLRIDYQLEGLQETDVDPNPLRQFQIWFDRALSAQIPEPNAMTLATATTDAIPSARIVLLKGFDERGFVFYTNYQSHKGQELTTNPHAALVFWWAELERQVRIEGRVEQVSAQESDEYYRSRPLNSRLGAWASEQSQVVESRAALEQRLQELQTKYENRDIPRPPYWGGFRVIPNAIEFWQGRPSRLHDRLRYRLLENGSWTIERLSP
ncbi:pyridoxamine 5'-phosphate oxidase [Chroococcidiopsis thermalis]|uniref:Pyridoxine/pyridoxamine 5'-phosphate oxidase n=1 Tax=Chroococcidiopsis thermalis (strain PCC 7203) TaxID=251229 RepID=K9U5I4_CHRTP|nr:pyridoxamine 5'-phosphate oxidase [Chroococcidiopsis thermalis]AFY90347.1 Pyridoxamine 5'-phosphate oxidase [Chroococcidiopsis thermalis PCC 7203]